MIIIDIVIVYAIDNVYSNMYGVFVYCVVNVDWIFHAFMQSNYSNE